ncbi:Spindle pole protein, putative [Giardia lamblia P15]|uniref:Spindle pole protein, putative n=1 Tax=Giardia intestinalis (strain P15) TaxID=658858 RepID=E1EZJ8_GIAIA|nr:Spindle pole protein, putative [Giardia lamblia P15]
MATQQTKVGLDYRRYTESKQASGSASAPNPPSSAMSISSVNRSGLRTTSKIPIAGLTRSVSNADRTDKSLLRGTSIAGIRPRVSMDRPASSTTRQIPGKSTATTGSASLVTSASARPLDKSTRKPQMEPFLKQSTMPGRGFTPQDRRPAIKQGKEMSTDDVKEAHPLSQEERLAARRRAETLHEHIISSQNIKPVLNSTELNHIAMPEPRAYEYPSRGENPLYKSRIQTKLVADAQVLAVQDHADGPPGHGIDASIEAAIPPSIFTKSCAMVTDVLNNPYAGISVENLLTEMARLEQLVKDTEMARKEAVAEMQEQVAAGKCRAEQLEEHLEQRVARIQALETQIQDMNQVTTGMIKERADLDALVQSLNATITSLQEELSSLVTAGKKQEEKHLVEMSDIQGAMQKAVEDANKQDQENTRLNDRVHELEGALNEAHRRVDAAESETKYIKTELMGLSEKVKEYVSNERGLAEKLTKKEAEIAQLQEEIHQHNSEKAMREFGKSAESLFAALITVDASSQVNFLDEAHTKEIDELKNQIARLETEFSNYKVTYSGVKVVPSENGDILQSGNNTDVRIFPCEHCNRGVDFVQTMLDLVDLRKMETEWMIDTKATKEENAKLKAALLELGRRYKALQATGIDTKAPLQQAPVPDSSSTVPLGTGLVPEMDFPGHQDPDEENRTLNFAYMKAPPHL